MMNKHWKRISGAALALTLAVSLLAGCTETAEIDPIRLMMGEESGITSDTVMLTVNGGEVTAGDLFFWLGQSAQEAASYSQALGEETLDWSAEAGEGMTMAEFVKNSARQQAVLYNVVAAKARENGYEFTPEDKAAYDEELAQAKEDLGGEAVYQTWLSKNCINEAGMEKLSSVGVLFNHMLDGMFQEGSEYAPTDEDLMTYAAENDLLYAKHILLLTQDTATGEARSAQEVDAQREKAEDILAQLRAVEDPEELAKTFDTLMKENSEDTGLQANPDGYLFTAGQMVQPFEEATRALDFGQVSDIVESDYGFHIILRLDPITAESLRSDWAVQRLNQLVDQWVSEAEIQETEAWTDLDIGEFYDKLTAFQAKLDAAAESAAGTDAEPAEPAEVPETQVTPETPETETAD